MLNRFALFAYLSLAAISNSFSQAIAADDVIVTYGIWRESVSVQELTDFCETGETSSALDYYLEVTNQEPDEVRRVLSHQMPVDGVVLSKLLNHPLGGFVLNQFSEVITTPSERASKESLRGALVTSALANNDISIIEVIQNYPTSEVHLNGDRLMEVYQQIESTIGKIPIL